VAKRKGKDEVSNDKMLLSILFFSLSISLFVLFLVSLIYTLILCRHYRCIDRVIHLLIRLMRLREAIKAHIDVAHRPT
jgi:hypothetical protein